MGGSVGSSQTKEPPRDEFEQVILTFKEFCVMCVGPQHYQERSDLSFFYFELHTHRDRPTH